MQIKVTCDVKLHIPLENLNEFQGELKTLSREGFEKLWNEILTEGLCAPCFVWKNDGKWWLLDGHQRKRLLEKKKSEGHKIPDIPCVEIIAKTRAEAARKLLAYVSQYGKIDNQGLYEFIELNEIDYHELVDRYDLPDTDIDGFIDEYYTPLEEPGDGSEDNVPDIKENELGVKLGDIYQLGEHRLMCGDSTDKATVEKLMNGEKADLWIADPPFGVSYMEKNAAVNGGIVKNQEGKEIKSDTKSVEELCPFWKNTALAAHAVTTNEASNYWCACQGSDKMMMMMMMDEAGWNIRHELIWVKDSFVFGRSDYHYRHEPIIYGWKKKGKHNWYSDRKQSSVFEIDRPNKSDLHPTTKPVELFSHFIKNSTKEGDKVFESFGGSGTTLIASESLGRVSYLMELDPHYCSVIIKRWEDYTGKKAKKLNE